ncbi:MAG: STAS domain-containing protein [Chloroherpetonaceae bacterium]|nr:STAS domain-containing protein [Chloroherpetonaceae bacterium]MDW8438636.1 STAS domain-containing protein [Chloroherpetonaceae bacterium]
MNFVIENKKDITIFRLKEKRLDAAIAPELKTQILMLVAEGKKYLIIDLSQVDAIDSSGIGALLIAHRHTAEKEGFAAFIGVHGNVKDLLQMTHLHKQLYIFSSVQEVLRNLEEVETDEEDVKSKKIDDDDEDEEDELDEIPEIPEVDLPGEEIEIAQEELGEPEFADESEAEFVEEEEKPKKKSRAKKAAKTAKAAKTKPAKSTAKPAKKSAPKAKAKKSSK